MTPHDLRQRRLALGWSVDQLAEKVGVSPRMVADWEDGSAEIASTVALDEILGKAGSAKEPVVRSRIS